MNKSLPIETFAIQAVANGCIAIPATPDHPLFERMFGRGEEANQVMEQTLEVTVQRILDYSHSSKIAVIEVRRFADSAEFDVCLIAHWENAVALDLAPALKELGLDVAARWLPDGRIVLPGTEPGQRWLRFAPDGSQTMAQNLRSAAAYIDGLYPDRKNTYFSLADFLVKQGYESPGQFGRALYKYTDCGPWTAFLCGEGDGVYYDDKKAWQTQAEQQWWDQCTGIEIGSIVEGSDVSIEGSCLNFPFTASDIDTAVSAINSEAIFYWNLDNCSYYSVLDSEGKSILYCQWIDGNDNPEGDFAKDDAPMLALAIAAYKALDNPEVNPLAHEHGRRIDCDVKIPIPGTAYFVKEEETPDYTY